MLFIKNAELNFGFRPPERGRERERERERERDAHAQDSRELAAV